MALRMVAEVAIRPYRPDDEAGLFSLARSVFGERHEWEDRRALDVLETDVVFIAEVAGTTAGYTALEREPEAVRIEQLLVAPEHEDEGVEVRLFEYAEGYAISVGARTLQAVVEGDNEQALSFYRERGFLPSGEGLLELILPQR
jgi:ribosomal protein S18 acetylase RimI-like enzyme